MGEDDACQTFKVRAHQKDGQSGMMEVEDACRAGVGTMGIREDRHVHPLTCKCRCQVRLHPCD